MRRAVHDLASVVSGVAVSLWLGGLVALGAITAPVVFGVVSMPQSADAMTPVFRRFDAVAMTCAAVTLAAEAVRRLTALDLPGWPSRLRGLFVALAAAASTFEGASVSPRIAELHASGAVRGVGLAGAELSRLHDQAELLGKLAVVTLAAVVALQALTRSRALAPESRPTDRRSSRG